LSNKRSRHNPVSTENPFIEVDVVKLNDPSCNPRDILEMLKDRNVRHGTLDTYWIGTEDHPKLRTDYPSVESFEKAYHREMSLLDFAMQKIRELKINFDEFLDPTILEKPLPRGEIYLILKYTANYKAPMRANYSYQRWFFDQFHEGTTFEEVEDGFLHFYQRREDFMNTLLDSMNPSDLRQWLKNHKFNIPEDLLQEVLSFLPKAE